VDVGGGGDEGVLERSIMIGTEVGGLLCDGAINAEDMKPFWLGEDAIIPGR
jgi:hypothetical protein